MYWNDDLSPYAILNAVPCKEFILLLRPLLWNIQTKRRYPNWDVTYAFKILFSRHIHGAILANALSVWLRFDRSCLCDLQKRVLNRILYLAVHSCFQIWILFTYFVKWRYFTILNSKLYIRFGWNLRDESHRFSYAKRHNDAGGCGGLSLMTL